MSFDLHLQLVDLVVLQRLLLVGGHGVLDGGGSVVVHVAVEQLVVVVARVQAAALPLQTVVPGRLPVVPLQAQLLQRGGGEEGVAACRGLQVVPLVVFWSKTSSIADLLLGVPVPFVVLLRPVLELPLCWGEAES